MKVVVFHTQCQAEDEVVDDREDEAGRYTIAGEKVYIAYQYRSLTMGNTRSHDITLTL